MSNLGKFCFLLYLQRLPVYLSLQRRGTSGAKRFSEAEAAPVCVSGSGLTQALQCSRDSRSKLLLFRALPGPRPASQVQDYPRKER